MRTRHALNLQTDLEALKWIQAPCVLQVGACIVSKDNVILGIGYNGFPRGCSDHQLPWAKRSEEGTPLRTKSPYVVHAEANAILNKNISSVAGAVSAHIPSFHDRPVSKVCS